MIIVNNMLYECLAELLTPGIYCYRTQVALVETPKNVTVDVGYWSHCVSTGQIYLNIIYTCTIMRC